jgi:hypothetical protein
MSNEILLSPEVLHGFEIEVFFEILFNQYYPQQFEIFNQSNECIRMLKHDFEVDMLESSMRKAYNEFDEMIRKEKLVLFPYILKLKAENKKTENCTSFKNTKQHHQTLIKCIETALDTLANTFINDTNSYCIKSLSQNINQLYFNFIELQNIKDKEYFKQYKSCNGCKSL